MLRTSRKFNLKSEHCPSHVPTVPMLGNIDEDDDGSLEIFINPCPAEFISGNRGVYLHYYYFLVDGIWRIHRV